MFFSNSQQFLVLQFFLANLIIIDTNLTIALLMFLNYSINDLLKLDFVFVVLKFFVKDFFFRPKAFDYLWI